MKTLDTTIKHFRQIAKEFKEDSIEHSLYYEQLAKWLIELKSLKEHSKCDDLDEASKYALENIGFEPTNSYTGDQMIDMFKRGAQYQYNRLLNGTALGDDFFDAAVDAWDNHVELGLMHIEEMLAFAKDIANWQHEKDLNEKKKYN